jgi:hypothetical protein
MDFNSKLEVLMSPSFKAEAEAILQTLEIDPNTAALLLEDLVRTQGWDIKLSASDVYLIPSISAKNVWMEASAATYSESETIPKQLKGEFHMEIRNTTFVNNIDVENMNEDAFIANINAVQKEISRLKDVGVESSTINNKIEKLSTQLDELVVLMDAKFAKDS